MALDILGADHRFVTPIHRSGNVDAQGVLAGDLTLGGRDKPDGTIAGDDVLNQVRLHSAHGGLTPQAAFIRSAGDRLRNPDQLRRSPATIAAAEAVSTTPASHYP